MSIGERVKTLRKRLNLTQKEFAAKIPAKTGGTFDYTYMGKIERGDILPSIKYLKNIATAFHKPLAYFFEGEQVVAVEKKDRRNEKVKALACLLARWNWELTDFRACRHACPQMPLCRIIKVVLNRQGKICPWWGQNWEPPEKCWRDPNSWDADISLRNLGDPKILRS